MLAGLVGHSPLAQYLRMVAFGVQGVWKAPDVQTAIWRWVFLRHIGARLAGVPGATTNPRRGVHSRQPCCTYMQTGIQREIAETQTAPLHTFSYRGKGSSTVPMYALNSGNVKRRSDGGQIVVNSGANAEGGSNGQLRQRGNVWWIRYYRNGRRYEESSGSDKKGVAVDLLKIREGDCARGVPVTPKVGRLRFEEAVADVENDYRVNGKRSLGHVSRRIRLHLTPFFGGRRMTAITTADVRAFVFQRQEAGASNAEVNRELAVLKRAFRLAHQAGKLLATPYVPMLREANARTGFFERDQFEAVCAALPAHFQPVATFAYHTGWRVPSEVLPLEWRQVDRERCIVRLDAGQTKNSEGRVFPYVNLPELRDTIEAQWAETERAQKERGIICPWVFHRNGKHFLDRDGAQCTPLRTAWAVACEAAGCPERILHDFRRTAVRNLVRAGVPERTAMQLTGHKTRCIFDRYDIVNESDLQNAVSKLAAATGTKRGQSAGPPRVARFASSAK